MTLDELITLQEFQSCFVTKGSGMPILHYSARMFRYARKCYFDLTFSYGISLPACQYDKHYKNFSEDNIWLHDEKFRRINKRPLLYTLTDKKSQKARFSCNITYFTNQRSSVFLSSPVMEGHTIYHHIISGQRTHVQTESHLAGSVRIRLKVKGNNMSGHSTAPLSHRTTLL